MNMVSIIQKKKEGLQLTAEEIKWFIDGYVKGDIPDYQASALLMAIYFQGLSKEETFHLQKVKALVFHKEILTNYKILQKHLD